MKAGYANYSLARFDVLLRNVPTKTCIYLTLIAVRIFLQNVYLFDLDAVRLLC